MLEFIWKYLIGPIVAEAIGESAIWRGVESVAGYNIYNTFAWMILGLSTVILIKKLFEKYEIDFTPETAFNLIPVIILAGVLRAVQDAVNLPLLVEILLITPVIYIWIALFTISLLALNQFRGLKFRYINSVIILAVLGLLFWIQAPLIPVAAVTIGAGVIGGLYYFLTEETSYGSSPLTFMVMSQFFEAFSSMYGLSQGYNARQLLTSTAVEIMGPLGFLLVKLFVLGAALKIYFDLEEIWRSILLVALYSIGFATGIRVILRAALGV
ncbi:MAG: DUF63 family protein [Candidatus Nanohaloarchaea archaeon]